MKTYNPKLKDINRRWYTIDASELSLGRLSTIVASLLLGKGKPGFAPHIDSGDFVVVTNAENLIATGGKKATKTYYRHSGYPGGLKQRTMTEQITRDPTRIIVHAVRGMLPDNKLRDGRLNRLKVYTGMENPHQAQQPKHLNVKAHE